MGVVLDRGRLTILGLGAVTLVAVGIWFVHPDRMLDRNWRGLVGAVENRNVLALRGCLAADYADRWGYDRETILVDARLAFRSFSHLDLDPREVRVVREGARAVITARLRLEADGDSSALLARDRLNAFADPFTFEWRRDPGLLGTWRLVRFDHPEFDPQSHRHRAFPGL